MTSRKNSDAVFSIEKHLKKIDIEKSEENSVQFDDALSLIGFGKIHFVILILCGLVLMSVINETMGMMFIMPASQCDLNLTSSHKGILSSVSYLGIMLSSHLWGYIADTKGRRKVIIYTTFASNFMSLISTFMSNFWALVFFRLLSGVFISGCSATIYAYLGEFNGQKYRATIITYGCCFVGIASVYIPSSAYLILHQTWSIPIYDGLNYRPWRLLILTYSLPGFISALVLLKLKESPKFLMSIGREDLALDVLKWMHRINNGSKIEYPVKKLTREVNEEHMENLKLKGISSLVKSMWNQTIPLVKPPYLVNFTVLSTLMFSIFMASAGMGMWFAEITNFLASDNAPTETLCRVIEFIRKNQTENLNNTMEAMEKEEICIDTVNEKVYFDAIYLGCAYIAGYFSMGLTIRPLGRGTLLVFLLSASGISGLLLHFIEAPQAIIIFFAFYLMFSGLCVSIVTATNVELFPTHLRAMAVCVVLMVGRLGSIVGTNIVGLLLEVNCSLTFTIFSVAILICAGLSLILPCK